MKKIILLTFFVVSFSLSVFSQPATVISENANLRGKPTVSGKVVEVLPFDSKVQVITQKGVWFLIQSDEYAGWVHGNTIRLSNNNSVVRTFESLKPDNAASQIIEEDDSDDYDSDSDDAELLVRILPPTAPVRPSAPPTVTSSVSASSAAGTTDASRTYFRGERGGCYYLNSTGNKSYVERSLCGAEIITAIPTPPADTSPGRGTVQVRGYYRKDGTYVRPHTRKSPSRRKN